MRIIDRYVLWTFIKNYLISFMVLIGMYIVLDMVFNFGDMVDVRNTADVNAVQSVLGALRDIGDYYFYQAFVFFIQLSGIIPVVAAAFTLMRLSRFNELTAILAAGVPLLRVAMPIILGGVVLNALMIVDQELILPPMLPKLARGHDELHRQDVKSIPIQGMQDSNRGLLYVGRYTPETSDRPATMVSVDVIERTEVNGPAERSPDPQQPSAAGAAQTSLVSVDAPAPAESAQPQAGRKITQANSHLTADGAVWNAAAQRWDLQNGMRVIGLAPDAPSSSAEPAAFYQSNITPEEIALYRSGGYVEFLSTSRIDELIARPGSYGQANLLRVKHWRFVQPIMNVILLLLAIPCVLTREPGNLKTAATKCLALTGLGMGSIFISHQIAGNPPSPEWAQTWPALIAWAPIFVFGPLAVYLLDRVKT